MSIFDVLQRYQDLDVDKRRQSTFQAVINTDQPIPSHTPMFSLFHEIDPAQQTSSAKRHVMPGTSRMAFGNNEQLSDMFQNKSKTHKTITTTNTSTSSKDMDVDDLHVDKITLAATSSNGGNKSSSQGANKQSSTKQAAPPSTDAKLSGTFPNKKPNPGNTTTTSTASNSMKPKAPITTSASKPTSAPGKPAAVSTNTQHGKAAAMAKMAAWGEEWPEEEELPGMMLPSTSSVNKIGDLNKDSMKQMHNSVQRQKKVIVAKKKV